MLDLMFLKLEGLRGDSFAPRHIGEIELSGFNWKHKHGVGAGAAGAGRSTISDLIVHKSRDRVSGFLYAAWTSGRVFPSGELTVERVTVSGNLIRTVRYKFESIILDFMSTNNGTETIELNFENMIIGL